MVSFLFLFFFLSHLLHFLTPILSLYHSSVLFPSLLFSSLLISSLLSSTDQIFSILSLCALFYPNLLCLVLSSPVMSCPVLSCHVLSCPVLCPVLTQGLLFYRVLLPILRLQGEPTKAREIFQKGENKAKSFGDAGFFQVLKRGVIYVHRQSYPSHILYVTLECS